MQGLLKSSGESFKDVPSEMLAKALRDFELLRAPRTHNMVALARYNVNLACCKRTWLVSYDFSAFVYTIAPFSSRDLKVVAPQTHKKLELDRHWKCRPERLSPGPISRQDAVSDGKRSRDDRVTSNHVTHAGGVDAGLVHPYCELLHQSQLLH